MMDMDHVPWLSRRQIGREAAMVLKEAGQQLGIEIAPPVPIEAIIEQVFGLHLLVEDLTKLYAGFSWCEELLGATILSRKQVLVHERLLSDPKEHGRYHFTCAHELGHWVLHRPLCQAVEEAGGDEGAAPVDILCRTSLGRQRGEWQADYMAACLLMPEAATREAFHTAISRKPILLVNREASINRGGGPPLCLEPVLEHVPYYAQEVIRAGNFTNVSRSAMGIRLQEMGLLVDVVNHPWEG